MKYKGYTGALTGVYKLERGEKKYSLQIRNAENKIVYESEHIYAGNGDAFLAAKKIIKQALDKQKKGIDELQSFVGLVDHIPKRQDSNLRWDKVGKISHVINSVIVVLLIFLHISQFFFLNIEIDDEHLKFAMVLLGILYAFFGLLFALVMGFWGIFAKRNGYTLSTKNIIILKILHLLNVLINKRFIPYQEQPFEKERGWYSSTPLIEMLFMGMISMFLLYGSHGYLYVSIIITLALIILMYFSSVAWEVAEEAKKGSFPFQRVVVPWLTLIVIALFVYFRVRWN